jgi:hypothetical protein
MEVKMIQEEDGRVFNCVEVSNTADPNIVLLHCNLPVEGYSSIMYLADKNELINFSIVNVLDPSELVFTFDRSVFDSTGQHISFQEKDKIVFHNKIWSQIDTININILFPYLRS